MAVDALGDLGLAGAHVVTHHERGIAHGERREHMLTQIRAERLAADRLDDEACPVQANAVFPAFAGVEKQRHLQRRARRAEHAWRVGCRLIRSEEHTSELQSLMRISYAVFCL